MIEITGYVTEKYEDGSFTLKITNDNVEDEKGITLKFQKK